MGPIIEVHIVKILDEWNRVSIPTICRPKDTSYVVFSRENERFVNEIHKHKAEVKSSVNCSDIFKNQTNESYE